MKDKKLYSVTSLAKEIGVHRQTIIYWMKKGWVKPKRDYRDYPVFTEEDVKGIIEWKNTLK